MKKNKEKYEDLEEEIQKKIRQGEKRKKKKMKVSGKSVFQLQKIIQKKAKDKDKKS